MEYLNIFLIRVRMAAKILIFVILIIATFARYEVRSDYAGRFKRAVVSSCKEWFANIPDEEIKDFFMFQLPYYEGVIIKHISNKLIKVQMFEDEEMKVQGEMMFLDGFPLQFIQRTFEERGFYPKELKEDL